MVLRAYKIRWREVILVFNVGGFLAQIPGARSLGTISFVRRRQCGSCLMSPFWWQEFWGGFYIFENDVRLYITQQK